ncbi:hypothetical protein [Cohnella candidum]|uniref:DZANK-type domain-containing protein n=1 Tax=Cohnella candidum TaxID=2674991 RepID=A0A3G3JYQ6_9BACL|nr:hypothetical protein [Cohnella candidum]AYQ72981.1 hypothetical protein EAV92_10650 [Cohnella candidum]
MSKKPELYPCIRCLRMPQENERFCADCGTPVQNRCSDEPGILRRGCRFVNPPTAAYCVKCGEPTVYQRNGLIGPLHPNGSKPSFLGFQ